MSSLLDDKCVFATRTDSLPWCFVNRAVPCCHGPYSSCSGKHRSNLGRTSELLGDLLMENNKKKEKSYEASNTLTMVIVSHLKQGLDQAYWDGTISVLTPL